MTYTITIPGRFPGLNDILKQAKQGRGNYQPYAIQKAQHTDTVACLCKAARIPKLKHIAMEITWVEPNRKRDPDNIIDAKDVLPEVGQTDHESTEFVIALFHSWKVDKHNPRIIVKIEEVPE